MEDKSMSPTAVAEVEAQKKRVYMEYSAAMYTQFTRLFIQAPVFVRFFLAIENMVEKVSSFQTGGAYWFIDLTIIDAFYILPILAAISCWITVEFTMQEGKCGGVWKNIARGGADLTLPHTTYTGSILIAVNPFTKLPYLMSFSRRQGAIQTR
ncbi:mitochondrial inner membrane protein OXA1 [Lactuca sativa]|uniref:mitochondrial inner membrane protein OXA1 n=1 Tax=Lactuca sativa TaxID=4236 RepID=UPI000CD8DF87|nr:mitochondrial inner membrane protein OXA1 [Lactuca sativa]XP_023754720.1 mitochondrial inner membrane protein OXA1 [Lactuca sativa]